MDLQTEFERIIKENVSRPGIEDLLTWLDQTDFYEAPSSTKYHGAFRQGLVLHSLNVYSHLKRLCPFYNCEASDESIAIVSLFHDLCKIGCYKQDWRNQKTYDPAKVSAASPYSVKHDNNGDFIWETIPTYRFEEDFAFGGHGSKSVYLLQNFIKLTPEEASAINSHMGQWEATQYGNPSAVYERNKLAWLLHVADEASSFIDESEKGEK